MTDVMTKYYDVIKRTSGALYQMFDGEKITHTELLEEADRILPKTLRNPNARTMPEYAAILGCVVDLYEAEVLKPLLPIRFRRINSQNIGCIKPNLQFRIRFLKDTNCI